MSAAATTSILCRCGLALVLLVRSPNQNERPVVVTLCELMLAYMLLVGAAIGFSTRQDGGILLGPLLMSFPLAYIWKYGRCQ